MASTPKTFRLFFGDKIRDIPFDKTLQLPEIYDIVAQNTTQRVILSLTENGKPIQIGRGMTIGDLGPAFEGKMYARLLPPYKQWTEMRSRDDQGNTISRLSLVMLNIYRCWAEIEDWQDSKHGGKILDRFNLQISTHQDGGDGRFDLSKNTFTIGAVSKQVIGADEKGEWKLAGGPRMAYIWSVFPKANDEKMSGAWRSKARKTMADYVEIYVKCVKRTIDAMLRTNQATDMVFNPCGGGAFLRKCPMERDIGPLIPLLITLGFNHAMAANGGRANRRLHIVGVKCDTKDRHLLADKYLTRELVVRHLGDAIAKSFFSTAASLPRVPDYVFLENADMISLGHEILRERPGSKVALTMAGDDRRLGNYYLGFEKDNRGRPLTAACPYIGARRASDENNTRRLDLMLLTMLFNSPSIKLGEPVLSRKGRGYARHVALTLEKIHRLIKVENAPRHAVLSAFGARIFNNFLDDMKAFNAIPCEYVMRVIRSHRVRELSSNCRYQIPVADEREEMLRCRREISDLEARINGRREQNDADRRRIEALKTRLHSFDGAHGHSRTSSDKGGAISRGGNAISHGGGTISHGGEAISHGGGAVSRGGGMISHGGGAISRGSGAVSRGGGTVSHGDGAISNGGGAISPKGGASKTVAAVDGTASRGPIYFDGGQSVGEWSWLDNTFMNAPITVNGKNWPSTEHYYQAQKFDAIWIREKIRKSATVEEARKLGRSLNFPIAPDWDENKKFRVMYAATLAKFDQNAKYRRMLIATAPRTIVMRSLDSFWGTGRDRNGKNTFGIILRMVRKEIMESRPSSRRGQDSTAVGTSLRWKP